MENKITETFVVDAILKHIAQKGWDYNVKAKGLHEKGCDIIVTNSRNKHKATRLFIEVKGKSYSKSAKSVNETSWLYALGQIVTRMNVIAKHAYKYGLGLPEVSAKIALRRIPWQVARHLCLYIFSVNDEGKVTEYKPKDFKKY